MGQVQRFNVDGSGDAKRILLRGDSEEKVAECTFEANEVYNVDVAFTTGEGMPREGEARTTIHKRIPNTQYRLRMKASRAVFNEVNTRFSTMPFSIRALEASQQHARMGIVECTNHQLLEPYPVLYEREGVSVAHVKFTVLLLPSGTVKICGMDMPEATTDKVPSEATQAILAQSARRRRKKKKKKAANAEE